jgi:hypothetical protein
MESLPYGSQPFPQVYGCLNITDQVPILLKSGEVVKRKIPLSFNFPFTLLTFPSQDLDHGKQNANELG